MSKSIRKFIRLEKSRIRKMPLDLAEKDKLISALYQRFPNLSFVEAKPKK